MFVGHTLPLLLINERECSTFWVFINGTAFIQTEMVERKCAFLKKKYCHDWQPVGCNPVAVEYENVLTVPSNKQYYLSDDLLLRSGISCHGDGIPSLHQNGLLRIIANNDRSFKSHQIILPKQLVYQTWRFINQASQSRPARPFVSICQTGYAIKYGLGAPC